MSTSRQSTCRWSSRAGVLGLAVLVAVAAGAEPPAPRRLPPFLDLFKDQRGPGIITRQVSVDTAVGPVRGYLARPHTPERLPAVLLVPGTDGLTAWARESARDLASVGYVTLTVDLRPRDQPFGGELRRIGDEMMLTEAWAAFRWLRGRDDVLPGQIGVVGWSWGSGQALALAASARLQACVLCDGPVSADPALLAGLRGTPLLGLFAARAESPGQDLPAFRRALAEAHLPHKIEVYEGVGACFLGPPKQQGYHRETADKAWVEVYEFLGKHVEDAPPPSAAPMAVPAVASIADLMRSVNEATGVRGSLLRDLEQEPTTARQWQRVRANAALMAETGNLLQQRTPPRDPGEHWHAEAKNYTAAAERLVAAAERHDYRAARRGVEDLGASCASCHRRHR
jgi:carboxymethylenebutenolidase